MAPGWPLYCRPRYREQPSTSAAGALAFVSVLGVGGGVGGRAPSAARTGALQGLAAHSRSGLALLRPLWSAATLVNKESVAALPSCRVAKWPTVQALAEASQEEVNELWAGESCLHPAHCSAYAQEAVVGRIANPARRSWRCRMPRPPYSDPHIAAALDTLLGQGWDTIGGRGTCWTAPSTLWASAAAASPPPPRSCRAYQVRGRGSGATGLPPKCGRNIFTRPMRAAYLPHNGSFGRAPGCDRVITNTRPSGVLTRRTPLGLLFAFPALPCRPQAWAPTPLPPLLPSPAASALPWSTATSSACWRGCALWLGTPAQVGRAAAALGRPVYIPPPAFLPFRMFSHSNELPVICDSLPCCMLPAAAMTKLWADLADALLDPERPGDFNQVPRGARARAAGPRRC